MATEKEVKITLTIDGVDKQVKNVKELEKEMSNLGKETKQASEEGTALGMLKGKISGIIAPLKGVVAGMKTLRGAIISTGIGALVVALGSLVAYFTSTEEGSKKLAIATEALGIIWGKITDQAAKLGEMITWAFTNPKEALMNFVNLVKQNIINRFEGLLELLPALGNAISELFKGNFANAGKIAGDAVAKVTLGVEDFTDKVVDAGTAAVETFKEITAEVKESVAAATQLVETQRALRDAQQALIVENAQLNQELEAQRKIAEDTTLSYEERAAALEKVGEAQVKLAENVAKQAQLEESLLKQQIAQEGNYEKREELETQLAEATAARIDAETALNTVKQESAKLGRELDLEELDRKTAINDMLKAMELENIEDAFVKAQAELDAQEAAALAELDRLRATEEEKQAIVDGFTEKRKRLKEEEADYEKALQQAVVENDLQLASGALSAISKLVGENTAFGKAAAIATTTIDTYMAAQKAYASQLTLDPTSPIRAAIAAGVAVANGLANVKAIMSTKTPGTASTPGGGTPARPNIRSFDPSGAQPTGTEGAFGDAGSAITFDQRSGQMAPIKAYVVAEDVSSAQEANKKIDDLARL